MQGKPAARPKAQNWAPPSHVSVFIRNLRLLRLDRRDGWPNITARTLSPSPVNQRQRVQAVEWALYHLFALWDPAGAQNKLRPFFPPLEPLQSVNLRAALFRALSDVKKNGDLGRETMLRKTMLDDCKGEKFEEVLAAFSTAVLRKSQAMSAADQPAAAQNLAVRLANAKAMTLEDHQLLVPLIIAHRASLGAIGQRRARVQQVYDDFSSTLEQKKAELASRAAEQPALATATASSSDNGGIDTGLVADIRANWLGGDDWAAVLIDGGSQSESDSFFEMPFSTAWKLASDQPPAEGPFGRDETDLLTKLEARVAEHQQRLQKWQAINVSPGVQDANSAVAPAEASPVSSAQQHPALVFRDHQSLNIASTAKLMRQHSTGATSNLLPPDRSFIQSLDDALSRINGTLQSRDVPTGVAALGSSSQPSSLNIPASPALSPAFEHAVLADDSPELEVHVAPAEPPSPTPPRHSDASTLVERTQKSMSLIPPSASKRLPERRRSPQPSLQSSTAAEAAAVAATPTVVGQFHTPQKQSSQSREPISRASTPRDELFDEDADYASVFKSRPRIAMSSTSSPAAQFLAPAFDLDTVGDDDSGLDGWVDSPLAARRRPQP